MGWYQVLANGKAPSGLQQGDYVVTGGGTWQITGVNPDGTYQKRDASTPDYANVTTQNYSGGYDYLTGYEGTQNSLLQGMMDYPEFEYGDAPDYNSQWDDEIGDLLGQANNYPDFSYDARTDPLFSQYRKQYIREGDRAYRENIGSASSMTGGQPNSYAYAAAAQGKDYYNAQISDKIPELYEQKYNQYLNKYNMILSTLQGYQNQENIDFGQYETELGQFNEDRNQSYSEYLNGYNMMNTNFGNASALSDTKYNQTFNTAQLGAQYGDPLGLDRMGIDTSNYSRLLFGDSGGSGGGGGGDDTTVLNEVAKSMPSWTGGDVNKYKGMSLQNILMAATEKNPLNEAQIMADFKALAPLGHTVDEITLFLQNLEEWKQNRAAQKNATGETEVEEEKPARGLPTRLGTY